jgi:hypothetical protein
MFQPTKEPPRCGSSAAIWNMGGFQSASERPFSALILWLSR